MVERRLSYRLAVSDAEKSLNKLKQFGTRGEAALQRLSKAAKPANRDLAALDRTIAGGATGLRRLGTAVTLVDGPLGGVAARFNLLSGAISSVGIAGAATIGSIAALTAGYVSFTKAAGEAEQRQLRVEAVLRATGNASGQTAAQLERFADELGEATLTNRNAVREAEAVLLSFRSVSGETFTRALTLAQDLAATFNQDLRGATIQLGKALEDPVEGLTALRRVGLIFSASQRDVIKEMVETGRQAEAQRLILEELERQVGGAGVGEAQGLSGATDGLAESWSRLQETLGDTEGARKAITGLKGVLDFFNESIVDTLDERIERNRQILEAATAPDASLLTRLAGPGARSRLDDLEQEAFERGQEERAALIRAKEGERREEARRTAERIATIEGEITDDFAKLSENRVQKIRDEGEARIRILEGNRTAQNTGEVDRLIEEQRRLIDAQVAQATAGERRIQAAREAAEARKKELQEQANRRVKEGLEIELTALTQTARERAIDTASRRLNADATKEQRQEVERLAAQLFDEKAAANNEEIVKALEEEREAIRLTARERFIDTELRKLNAQATKEQIKRIRELAGELFDENEKLDETENKLISFAETNREVSQAIAGGFVDAITGAESFGDALDRLDQALLRILSRPIEQFLSNAIEGILGGILNPSGGSGDFFSVLGTGLAELFHKGGRAGQAQNTRRVPTAVFAGAERRHSGDFPGIFPGEVPAILRRNETVMTENQTDNMQDFFRTLIKQILESRGIRGNQFGNVSLSFNGDVAAPGDFSAPRDDLGGQSALQIARDILGAFEGRG